MHLFYDIQCKNILLKIRWNSSEIYLAKYKLYLF